MNTTFADIGRVRQRLVWKGGSLELMGIQADEPRAYRHSYPAHGALLMLSGCMEIRERRLDGRPVPRELSHKDEINFFPIGTMLSGVARGRLRYLRIYFQPDFLPQAAEGVQSRNQPYEPIVGQTDALCSTLARQLEREIRTGAQDTLFAETAALLVALQLVRLNGRRPDGLSRSTKLSGQYWRLISDYIEANLDRNITLTELADHVGLSLTHFCRLFRNRTGRSPYRFVIERRVERARTLLQETALPITEIALAVGFNSQSHLTTQFRRALGIAPARYRSEVSTVRLMADAVQRSRKI